MVIVEGVPAYLYLDEEYIAHHLGRRQRGYGRGGRQQIERDHAHIQTGVRHGYTLGSPIGMLIENRDWVNWQEGRNQRVTRIRPGHADLPGAMKYGFHDVRNSLERASARETAARVAAGAVAMKLLEEFGIKLHSHVLSIGRVKANPPMMAEVDAAREAGDTVGGVVEVIAEGVPIGLGSHVHWDRKIDAKISQALMSINAVKAVSIGEGWDLLDRWGSEFQDVIEPVTDPDRPWQRKTNRAGGTEGGMTSGTPLVARFVIKPIATLHNPLPSVDLDTGEPVQAHFERSDVCQAPPAGVIGEAMMALVLADAFMEKFGGDSIPETKRNFEGYQATVGPRLRYS
ncbi:Chorismate synthase [Geodia barretti]|uniref:chorismate synthase n=1 Tax=Geodia barretti TaxID=519541 RepID=A0AA35RHG2_GEOBA|nr:Chorismate synthase [Geodia barretti]